MCYDADLKQFIVKKHTVTPAHFGQRVYFILNTLVYLLMSNIHKKFITLLFDIDKKHSNTQITSEASSPPQIDCSNMSLAFGIMTISITNTASSIVCNIR